MKFNSDEDQVIKVDNGTDAMQFLRNVIDSGLQKEAFFVFDVEDVIRKYNNWKEKLPRVFPYYAVKCNYHPLLFNVLSSLGVGFDCASKEEIKNILSLGVDKSRIIFANSKKQSSAMKYAEDQQIELSTFDSECELYKFKEVYPSAKLILRFKCDARKSARKMGPKFGCDSVTEAPALMHLARTLNLEIVGVSFHVGTNCGEPAAFGRAIAIAHDLFDLGKSIGFHMHILNIGGGFPGISGSTFDVISSVINKALDIYFPIDSNVNIVAEPGRYFAASAFTLATLIYTKRVVSDPTTGLSHHVYYINDGIYGSFFLIMYNVRLIQPCFLSDVRYRQIFPSTIIGPSNHPQDVIIKNVKLPNLEAGEWIIFKNMGAYTISAHRPSNIFPIPKVFSIVKNSTTDLCSPSSNYERELQYSEDNDHL